MRLDVLAVTSAGMPAECIVLRVRSRANLGAFVLARGALAAEEPEEHIDGNVEMLAWLPEREVRAGDVVRVFTVGPHAPSADPRPAGPVTHVFRLGRTDPVFRPGDAAVLFEMYDYTFRGA